MEARENNQRGFLHSAGGVETPSALLPPLSAPRANLIDAQNYPPESPNSDSYPPVTMSKQLSTTLATTLTLLEQFQDTVSPSAAANIAQTSSNSPNALSLVSASSATLKAQVTKLSLLTITSPFTHSAVTGVLRACNDSVLPSLVTAALLVTPTEYTKAFQSEVLLLARSTLVEFTALVQQVKSIAEKKDEAKKDDPKKKEDGLLASEKDAVTLAAGRVWDACDAVVELATKGVVGFVMRRVEQWRDLVKDAVVEIEEWDPEERDDFFDDLMGSDKDDEEDGTDGEEEKDDDEMAALQERKKSTLRLLRPVIQVYPAVITNRLKKAGNAPLSSRAEIAKLESLMSNLQSIPEHVDEVAGALYEGDMTQGAKHLREIQKSASQAVRIVALPWSTVDLAAGEKAAEDKFTIWSRTWFKVMDEVSKSISADSIS